MVIKVFISCPSDVEPEKKIIKDVCEHIQTTYLKTGNDVVFKIYDYTNLTGKFNNNPQEDINDIFNDYDIYIGILWMKLGTTTKNYLSGTVEEYHVAYNKSKSSNLKGYIFFKSPKVTKSIDEARKLLDVFEFKDTIFKNGWVQTVKNSSLFRQKINDILTEYIREKELEERQNLKSTELDSMNPTKISELRELLISGTKSIEIAIQRTFTRIESADNKTLASVVYPKKELLKDIVLNHKKVVILGNAGSGKSVELSEVVKYFSKDENGLVPIFKRLNTYVDEDISDYLPKGWKDIPQQIQLIILDGLDEIQPQNINTAIRKILSFSENHPQSHIVVSSRTNFYETPLKEFNGTLPDFNVFRINELEIHEINKYFAINHNDTEFVGKALDEGYSGLIKQPFFMNLLHSVYMDKKTLKGSKTDLFSQLIEQRFKFDKAHFQLTKDASNKSTTIKILQRIALTMEYLGKNFISNQELEEILANEKEIELIRYYTAFNKNDSGNWAFEHNNIQEYLAADALRELKFESIIDFISLNKSKIKPTWVNTLFFLMSIAKDELRISLTNWIVNNEPELLVKIESDKLTGNQKFEIFQNIYNFYKEKDIWLYSNKFDEKELANFADSDELFDFLIKELNDLKTTRTTIINVLNLLEHLQPNDLQSIEAEKTLILTIKKYIEDPVLIYESIKTIVKLNLQNSKNINQIFKLLSAKKNQYIRAAMYLLINKGNENEKYIEYYINGIGLFHTEFDERDRFSLFEEEEYLRKGLSKISTYDSIVKLIELFSPNETRKFDNYFDKDVLEAILNTASMLYIEHPEIFQKVFICFKQNGKYLESQFINPFKSFFENTKTNLKAFKYIIQDDYKQFPFILGVLLNEEVINFIFEEYGLHNISKQMLLDIYSYSFWYKQRTGLSEENIEHFKNAIRKNTDYEFSERQESMFDEVAQSDLNLLFDPILLTSNTYDLIQSFENNELINVNSILERQYKISDTSSAEFPRITYDILLDFSRKRLTVDIQSINNLFNDPNKFELYRLKKIKNIIANENISIHNNQIEVIKLWLSKEVNNLDFANAITFQDKNIKVNHNVRLFYFYIMKYGIPYNPKILDLTLFNDFDNHTKSENNVYIESLIHIIDRNNLDNKVLQNIKNGIKYSPVWRNNVTYAIKNKISMAYPSILTDLCNSNLDIYDRKAILDQYFNETNDTNGIKTVLEKIGRNILSWRIIEILISQRNEKDFITNHLLHCIRGKSAKSDKIIASKYLIQLNDLEGFDYYVNYILKEKNPTIDYYHNNFLQSAFDIRFIPGLLKLLKLGKNPEFLVDNFNRLDTLALNALFSIGLYSHTNLIAVKEALIKFIENNRKIVHINFIHLTIEKMEHQFYVNSSQVGTIDDALDYINKIL